MRLKGRLFPPRELDAAVDEELRFHIEGRTQDLISEGFSPADARSEALRRFGDLGGVQRACLDLDRQRQRHWSMRTVFRSLLDDAVLAARSLRRSWAFSLLVVATLTLGIGATVAIWSAVDRALLQPLPFERPEELVQIWQTDRLTGTVREPTSIPDYFDFKERSRTLEEVAAYRLTEGNLLASAATSKPSAASAEPRRVGIALVTHDLLPLLGRDPILGRNFSADDDIPNGPSVAMLEESFWREVFAPQHAADDSVLGKTIRVDDQTLTVIGVVPAGLEVPSIDAQVWLPMQQTAETSPRYRHSTLVIGRLLDSSSLEMVQAETTEISKALEAEYRENADRGAFVEPLVLVHRGELRPALLLLLSAVLIVMLIMCANVANLVLARGASRAGETAMSAALGASTLRLGRRFVIESALLVVAATVMGAVLANLGFDLLLRQAPPTVQRLGELTIDWRLLGFAAALSAALTLVLGLAPVLQVRRFNLNQALRSTQSRSSGQSGIAARRFGVRQLLVVAQFAFALPLLCGAGLLLMSLHRLGQVDGGFQAGNVLRLDYQLPSSRYPRDFAVYPNWSEVHRFNNAMLEGARVMPGVVNATLTSNHPLDAGFTNSFIVVGRESEASEQGELKTRLVSPGYFETNGVRLLEGRLFDSRDRLGSLPVLILNQRAVDRYFHDKPVLGERIAFWGIEREIVGIVSNERMHGLDQEPPEAMYSSLPQSPQVGGITLMVKTEADPEMLIAPLRALAHDLDPEIAVFNVSTMDETVARSLTRRRFTSMVLVVFALVAALLSALGTHSVLSYLVTLRRREVGIRVAMGATRKRVIGDILREGLVLAGVGVAIGVACSLGLSTLLDSLLYGVSRTDLSTYVMVSLALLALGALACGIPARKAAGVDPARVLAAD